MKKTIITSITSVLFAVSANAQYDLTDFATNNSTGTNVENNLGDLYYSSNFSNTVSAALHTVDLTSSTGPDTIYFPVSIDGEIYPTDGPNGEKDTLRLEIAVGFWGLHTNYSIATTEADFTIQNKFESYSYTNQTRNTQGASKVYDEFTFVEGDVDTVKVIVTAGLFSLDRLYIRSSNVSVLSNASQGIFDQSNAVVNNPVVGNLMTINLPQDVTTTTISLLSLDGQVIETKHITKTDNSFDVSNLSGIYLLRELSTASVKKVVIE